MNRPKINLGVIDENSASQAIEIVGKLAEENGIDWALVGGLAMNLCKRGIEGKRKKAGWDESCLLKVLQF